jgi:hypothetical protein
MKFVFLIAVALAGCAPIAARNNYVNAMSNLRSASSDTITAYARDVALYIKTNGEAGVIDVATKSLARSLKDPDSARFQNVRLAESSFGKVVCGEANAKNSYGGYTGFKRFVAGTNGSTFYNTDTRYPEISAEANSGLIAACGY